jgi:UDP-glucuronate 4-epimerase
MTTLVTGAAGFIGYHVARKLADRGERVIGIDNLSESYGFELKRRRLVQLSMYRNLRFQKVELGDAGALSDALKGEPIDIVVHLAAQPNVRLGVESPHAYLNSNVLGHLNLLEYFRDTRDILQKLIYTSSSSVYGSRNHIPFHEGARTEHPSSLYGVTKKSQEMISEVYSELFGIPQIALRLFSVYGPWGRPDMAYWLFTDAILTGKPIHLYSSSETRRDFTYIDDVVAAILAVIDAPAATGSEAHRVYNVGSGSPVPIAELIAMLEAIIGKRTVIETTPVNAGEMEVTYADISAIEADFGYRPRVSLEEGLKRFVDWFRRYQRMR